MSDNPLIERALEQAAFHETEMLRFRRFVNDADAIEGREPRFGDLAAPNSHTAGTKSATKRWQPGDLLGKPFANAVRLVLEARFNTVGGPAPASVDEIHDALIAGTFDFGTAGTDGQKQSIRISLGKNTAAFVRLPNTDLFGLPEWYPGLKKPFRLRIPPNNRSKESSTSAGPDEAGGEEAAPNAAPNVLD